MRAWMMMAGVLVAGQAVAQAADEAAPRIIQSDAVVVVKSAGDADGTARTDPLTQVAEVALKLSFTCADTGCGGASSQLTAEGATGDAAAIVFTPAADGLHAAVGGQTMGLVVKQGETFDLRIHWNDGHRVTFDLYRTDPASGVSTMESRDAVLKGGVEDLAFTASHGALTLVSQNYRLR